MIVTKDFTFEASHVLPEHPGKCSRLHGHSWKLAVSVIGEVDPETGFVVDYAELSKLVNEHIIDKLDHTHLGCGKALTGREGEELQMWRPYFGWTFYPSSENLVRAIARVLEPLVQELRHGVTLFEVELKETCTSAARWRYSDTPEHGR